MVQFPHKRRKEEGPVAGVSITCTTRGTGSGVIEPAQARKHGRVLENAAPLPTPHGDRAAAEGHDPKGNRGTRMGPHLTGRRPQRGELSCGGGAECSILADPQTPRKSRGGEPRHPPTPALHACHVGGGRGELAPAAMLAGAVTDPRVRHVHEPCRVPRLSAPAPSKQQGALGYG